MIKHEKRKLDTCLCKWADVAAEESAMQFVMQAVLLCDAVNARNKQSM